MADVSQLGSVSIVNGKTRSHSVIGVLYLLKVEMWWSLGHLKASLFYCNVSYILNSETYFKESVFKAL